MPYYPKSLYQNGDPEGTREIARNAEQEKELRERGYWHPMDIEEKAEQKPTKRVKNAASVSDR